MENNINCSKCNGTRDGGGYLIKREKMHKSINSFYTKDIATDPCIGKEVEYLLSKGVATIGNFRRI